MKKLKLISLILSLTAVLSNHSLAMQNNLIKQSSLKNKEESAKTLTTQRHIKNNINNINNIINKIKILKNEKNNIDSKKKAIFEKPQQVNNDNNIIQIEIFFPKKKSRMNSQISSELLEKNENNKNLKNKIMQDKLTKLFKNFKNKETNENNINLKNENTFRNRSQNNNNSDFYDENILWPKTNINKKFRMNSQISSELLEKNENDKEYLKNKIMQDKLTKSFKNFKNKETNENNINLKNENTFRNRSQNNNNSDFYDGNILRPKTNINKKSRMNSQINSELLEKNENNKNLKNEDDTNNKENYYKFLDRFIDFKYIKDRPITKKLRDINRQEQSSNCPSICTINAIKAKEKILPKNFFNVNHSYKKNTTKKISDINFDINFNAKLKNEKRNNEDENKIITKIINLKNMSKCKNKRTIPTRTIRNRATENTRNYMNFNTYVNLSNTKPFDDHTKIIYTRKKFLNKNLNKTILSNTNMISKSFMSQSKNTIPIMNKNINKKYTITKNPIIYRKKHYINKIAPYIVPYSHITCNSYLKHNRFFSH